MSQDIDTLFNKMGGTDFQPFPYILSQEVEEVFKFKTLATEFLSWVPMVYLN